MTNEPNSSDILESYQNIDIYNMSTLQEALQEVHEL